MATQYRVFLYAEDGYGDLDTLDDWEIPGDVDVSDIVDALWDAVASVTPSESYSRSPGRGTVSPRGRPAGANVRPRRANGQFVPSKASRPKSKTTRPKSKGVRR